LYLKECVDDLDVPEEDEEDDNWRIGGNIGAEPGDCGEFLSHIRRSLPTRVDGDEGLQELIRNPLFCLA
jgi:hypothetical protein